MKIKTFIVHIALLLAMLPAISGNAWGFGIEFRAERDNAMPVLRGPASWRSDDEAAGPPDGFWPPPADAAGPVRFGDGQLGQRPPARRFSGDWNRGWPRHDSGHPWWRDFLLSDCIDDIDLSDWFLLKKKLLGLLIWHLHEHHSPPPATVPLPAPLLLFGSGLIGLAGLLRRGARPRASAES